MLKNFDETVRLHSKQRNGWIGEIRRGRLQGKLISDSSDTKAIGLQLLIAGVAPRIIFRGDDRPTLAWQQIFHIKNNGRKKDKFYWKNFVKSFCCCLLITSCTQATIKNHILTSIMRY